MTPPEPLIYAPSITISYARLIARHLRLSGKELNHLLKDTSLRSHCLGDEDTLLTGDQQIQIIRNAITLSNDPGFGLRFGQSLSPMTLGPIGFLANSSPDLLTAIEGLQKYLPSRVSFAHLELTNENHSLKCRFTLDFNGDNSVYRCLIECLSLTLLSLVEFILGEPLKQGALYYNYPYPDYVADYKDYISCPITFNAAESCLILPNEICRKPNVSSDHINYDFALRQCEEMSKQLQHIEGITRKQVKALLFSYPPGKLNEEEVAAQLFISKRTLARRLAKEGTGFKPLRDEMLSSMASAYLRNTLLSIESIGLMLNYHSGSNFRRAFKRWFKKTPESYRKQFKP